MCYLHIICFLLFCNSSITDNESNFENEIILATTPEFSSLLIVFLGTNLRAISELVTFSPSPT